MAKKPKKKRATQSPAARARERKRELKKKSGIVGEEEGCISKALWVGRLTCGVAFASYITRTEKGKTTFRKGDIPHLEAGLRTVEGTANMVERMFPSLSKDVKAVRSQSKRILTTIKKGGSPKEILKAVEKPIKTLQVKAQGVWTNVERTCQ